MMGVTMVEELPSPEAPWYPAASRPAPHLIPEAHRGDLAIMNTNMLFTFSNTVCSTPSPLALSRHTLP